MGKYSQSSSLRFKSEGNDKFWRFRNPQQHPSDRHRIHGPILPMSYRDGNGM